MKTYYILSPFILALLSYTVVAQETDTFMVVEEQPEPNGGMAAFYEYVSENLVYPVQARRLGVEGTVYLQFVVDKDGSITDVKVIKGIGSGCDIEAVRVLKNAPKWKPGKQKGKPVKVRITIPIVYKLAGEVYDEEAENTLRNQYILLNNKEVTNEKLENTIKDEYSLAFMKNLPAQESMKKYGSKASEGALIVYSNDFEDINEVLRNYGVEVKVGKKKGVYEVKFSYLIPEKAEYTIGIGVGEDIFSNTDYNSTGHEHFNLNPQPLLHLEKGSVK